ncbi:cytochrome P450 [Mesorhizobium sp. LHD-90]|uniref:cytochrome P450 n=1 Tax=Mesorhizobium sp. LHD-90 TaxID=3071414 RepID=UPI0027E1EE58|nr:cytochrome P450 [Mesorhizobium sp. LHD-90]MDQ6437379.1 cytochrome P450 [Mesorhizobium sp. LHD-90]
MNAFVTGGAPISQRTWIVPRHAPLTPAPSGDSWFVTRYADAMSVLRNPLVGPTEPWTAIARVGQRAGRDFSGLANLLQGMLFSPNDPDHPGLRTLVRKALAQSAPAFAPDVVSAVVRDRLATARRAGQVEAMEDICRAIPTAVMANALGISLNTVQAIRKASLSIFPVYARALPLTVLAELEADAVAAESAILDELSKAEGGLAALVALNDAGFGFSTRTLARYVFFLVLAGVETLTGLFGNMILLLHLNRDARETVAADRGLIAPFVEEAVRYAGPMRAAAPRVALADTTVGEQPVRKGDMLLVDLEQAHHDPVAYRDPERFDINREGPPNMAFGLGAHACLGAALGRLEARIFLDAMLDEAPMVPVKPGLEWERHVSFRRLQRLDVAFEA